MFTFQLVNVLQGFLGPWQKFSNLAEKILKLVIFNKFWSSFVWKFDIFAYVKWELIKNNSLFIVLFWYVGHGSQTKPEMTQYRNWLLWGGVTIFYLRISGKSNLSTLNNKYTTFIALVEIEILCIHWFHWYHCRE